MYRIYLVEDDEPLARAVKKQLETWSCEVLVVKDFSRVTEEFLEYRPHLVLMDIHLPQYDGFHWCAELRRHSHVPIIFLSCASDNMNIVMAINMGGDDFIAKPVDAMVLTAKVRSTLRRAYEFREDSHVLSFHGCLLDLNDATVERDGQRTELTKNEFRILRTLLEHRGRIVSRDTLMLSLWQDDCYVEENTLTVNISRLRKKLESIGMTDVIRTKPGNGYLIP